MSDAFHLSLDVADLERSRQFYVDLLGCRPGRTEPSWCNIDFFGHQLTLHQHQGHHRPDKGMLDHFGVNLDYSSWQAILKRVQSQRTPFLVPPSNDQRRDKFVIQEPDEIGIEFKHGG